MFDELEELLKAAVGEVFRTMLSFDTRSIPFDSNAISSEAHIAGSVRFFGDRTGVVYIFLTAAFARTMTGKMLGMSDTEVEGDEMVNAAVGELANMIVGSLKTNLVERDHPCVLTIPSIGSEAVTQECKNYAETKDWRFMGSFEGAMPALN